MRPTRRRPRRPAPPAAAPLAAALRPLPLLLLLLAASAPGCFVATTRGDVAVAPQGARAPFAPGDRFRGQYECAQGPTDLTLTVMQVDGLRVAAVFEFAHPSGAGSYELFGAFDPPSATLTMQPGAWIQRPPGYVSVGMSGTLSPDGLLYTGRITDPACGSFFLRRGP